ncbi:MAG TPA: Rnf-Nqr domain containing protein [Spirochaetales bacterium]|nr:Rnf-Nqr domain containing protein [Spirochaetales bacterium]
MNGHEKLWKENPVFIGGIGLCPALAVTNRFDTAWILGVLVVLIGFLGNLTFWLLRRYFHAQIEFYIRILIIAFWVTIMEILLEAFLPDIWEALGIYLPLLAVNTMILLSVKSYPAGEDAKFTEDLLLGLGYVLSLGFFGAFREILGSGTLTLISLPQNTVQYQVFLKGIQPIRFLLLPAGALITYGYFRAGFLWIGKRAENSRAGE